MEEFDSDYICLGPKHRTRPRIDLHLNSPLRPSSLILLEDAIKLYPNTKYNEDISTDKIKYIDLPQVASSSAQSLINIVDQKLLLNNYLSYDWSEIVGHLYSASYDPVSRNGKWVKSKSELILSSSISIIKLYDKRLLKEFNSTNLTLDSDDIRMYTLKVTIEDIRDQMTYKANSEDDTWTLFPFPYFAYSNILVNRSYAILIASTKSINKIEINPYRIGKCISNLKGKHYVITYDQLLCLLDTVISRSQTLLFNKLLSDDISYKIDPTKINKIYKCFDDLFIKMKNDSYEEIKMFETTVQALMKNKTDILSFKDDLLKYVRSEIDENNFTHLPVMIDLLNELDHIQLSAISGIYRHWGHPLVDEVKACEKVFDLISKHLPIPDENSIEQFGLFKRFFCISFISEHSRWPNCDVRNVDPNSTLIKLIERNERRVNMYLSDISLKDWSDLIILKELEFDYHIDYTGLLSDTAVAPLRSERKFCYNRKMSGLEGNENFTTSRRLLNEVLNRETIDIEEICNIIRARKVPHDWLCILLSPKELELKVAARLFAMLVPEMRLYCCILEKNISEKLFKYFPQQAASLNEEKLHKRLINMSSRGRKRNVVPVYSSLDFKSWNLHWGIFNTSLYTQFLDDIFGTENLFGYIHYFFSECEVSLSSNFYIPDHYMNKNKKYRKIKQRLAWTGHRIGFEGLCQKLWTLITIAILLSVEHITGLKSEIIGQGDNQICKVHIPIEYDPDLSIDDNLLKNDKFISSEMDRFKEVLYNESNKIGLELKLCETWTSHSNLVFCKNRFINGAAMPDHIKKGSKLTYDTNDAFPTLANRTASIQSCGFTMSHKSYNQSIPWILSNLETGLMMNRDILKLRNHGKIDEKTYIKYSETLSTYDFWFWFLNSNNEITGVPLVNLINYEFRGHPDPFCSYVTYLHHVLKINNKEDLESLDKKCYDSINRWLKCIDYEKFIYGLASPELILTNPSALNFVIPKQISSEFKDQVHRYLSHGAKNLDIKHMFYDNSKYDDKAFFEYLSKTRPFYPRAISVIVQASPVGTRNYIQSRFTDVRTIQNMANVGNNISTPQYIVDCDLQSYTFLFNTCEGMMKIKADYVLGNCPTKITEKVRNNSFKELLDDDPVLGVTMPHPLHTMEISYNNIVENKGYISLLCQDGVFTKDKLFTCGDQPAYIGSRTSERTSGKIIIVKQQSRPLKDACRLRLIQQWAVSKTSPFNEFINNLIQSRTNTPFDLLEMIGGGAARGSVNHRVNDMSTRHDTMNATLHSFTTHFALSTDKLELGGRTDDNFNFHCAAHIHMLLKDVIKEVLSRDNEDEPIKYVTGTRTNKCCHEAYTDLPMSNSSVFPNIPIDIANPLMYQQINEVMKTVVPESMLIKTTNNINPAAAMGMYCLSKLRGIHSFGILSQYDISGPYTSRISLSELRAVGVSNVVYEFAKHLFLYLGNSDILLDNVINNIDASVWGGISEMTLMPELLSELVDALELDGIVDAYKDSRHITKMLNRLLQEYVKNIRLSDDKSHIYKHHKWFICNNNKIPNILLTWSYLLLVCNLITINNYEDISKIIIQSSNNNQLTTIEIYNLVIRYIISLDDGFSLMYLIKNNKISLAEFPPEYYFRSDVLNDSTLTDINMIKRKKVNDPIKIKQSTLINIRMTDYVIKPIVLKDGNCLKISNTDTILINDSLNIPNLIKEKINITRSDHAFRNYNTISSGFYKFAEVIIKEHVDLSKENLAIADGEGSVALCVALMTGKAVHYCSKYTDEPMETQRYENFVPGSFINHRDLIKSHMLSILYGGDITDDYYFKKFINEINNEVGLVTIDAEVSGLKDSNMKFKMILSYSKIIKYVRPDTMILKDYLADPIHLAVIIGMLMLYYKNVKIIKPSFSSFENSEILIFASEIYTFDASIFSDDISFYTIRDYMKFVDIIIELRQKIKRFNVPLLYYGRNVHLSLNNLAKELGFHLNCKQSVQKLFKGSVQYEDNIYLFKENLKNSYRNTKSFMEDEVELYVYTIAPKKFKKPTWLMGLHYSSNHSLMRTLHDNTDILLSIEILSELLECKSIKHSSELLFELVNRKRWFKIKGQNIFDYTIRNSHEWLEFHSKYIWRIWGFYNQEFLYN
nr:MAG: RNA-directed RNA polymerase [Vaokses virus]